VEWVQREEAFFRERGEMFREICFFFFVVLASFRVVGRRRRWRHLSFYISHTNTRAQRERERERQRRRERERKKERFFRERLLLSLSLFVGECVTCFRVRSFYVEFEIRKSPFFLPLYTRTRTYIDTNAR